MQLVACYAVAVDGCRLSLVEDLALVGGEMAHPVSVYASLDRDRAQLVEDLMGLACAIAVEQEFFIAGAAEPGVCEVPPRVGC